MLFVYVRSWQSELYVRKNIYHPQTKFAKVMFLHLSVILLTAGVYTPWADHLWANTPPPTRQTPSLGRYPQAEHHPPLPPEMATTRSVRILLECILVQI